MTNEQQKFGAPWGRLLMGMSGGVVALFIGIALVGKANGALMLLFPLVLLLALVVVLVVVDALKISQLPQQPLVFRLV